MPTRTLPELIAEAVAAKKKSSTVLPLQCPLCGRVVGRGGHSRGAPRYRCPDRKICKWHGHHPIGENRRGMDAKVVSDLRSGVLSQSKSIRRYVITSAQNATKAHIPAMHSLLTYCKLNNATLLVIPYRYRNPTSMWSKNAEHDDWWDALLMPHLMDQRVNLCKGLVLLANIKTQPTAASPLLGLEGLTGIMSAIVGHPRIEFKTVATMPGELAKIMTSTGAITVPNYIPSKAGAKGEHHHTIGACLVEIEADETFHIRQIIATKDGGFQDLNWIYNKDGRTPGIIEALVLGDLHAEFIDPEVSAATFHKKTGMVAILKPKRIVYHDVHDFYAGSHHHKHETFIRYAKHHAGTDNVERGLDNTFDFIDSVTPPGVQNVFVASNHHDHLGRWVKEFDPRGDFTNSVFWARTFEAMCLGAKMTETGARTIDPFAYWGMLKMKTAKQAKFLGRNESYVVKGIELALHGDVGSNGSRGSRSNLSKIGAKIICGHSHSPGITEGAYQVGLSGRYNMEYAAGPSSWLHCHAVVYANGKRTLIAIIDGRWRA